MTCCEQASKHLSPPPKWARWAVQLLRRGPVQGTVKRQGHITGGCWFHCCKSNSYLSPAPRRGQPACRGCPIVFFFFFFFFFLSLFKPAQDASPLAGGLPAQRARSPAHNHHHFFQLEVVSLETPVQGNEQAHAQYSPMGYHHRVGQVGLYQRSLKSRDWESA